MTKAKAGKAAMKQPRRVGDETPKERPDEQRAYIVSGAGTDDEIRARCLADVPGFDDMDERVQGELVRLMRAFWEMPVAPQFEVQQNDDATVIRSPEGSNITLSAMRTVETFASNSADFANRRIDELCRAGRSRKSLSTESLMADLAFITGGGARDTVQSSLLTQMAATHSAALTALNLSMRAEFVDQSAQMGNLASRLLNTYARQAETLAKLQRDGTQTVKHIHIDNRHGGQAVVAETIQTGGANARSTGPAHATAAVGAGSALLGQDTEGHAVPVTGGSESEALSYARLCAGIGREAGE